jgi:CRISPR type IV-associated protein Csf3
MTPIVVRAHMRSSVCLPADSVALDSLLAAAVCVRDHIPPALSEKDIVPIEIPLAREPGGRFHLASVGHLSVLEHELQHTNKRAVVEEYKVLGKKIGSVNLSSGHDKPARIPRPVMHTDLVTWWAMATDVDDVRSLLGIVSHVGKKRSVGLGKVARWEVEATEPWGDGFPILLPDGTPTRPIPSDYSGVREDAQRGWRCVTYPYWRKSAEESCYLPEAIREG